MNKAESQHPSHSTSRHSTPYTGNSALLPAAAIQELTDVVEHRRALEAAGDAIRAYQGAVRIIDKYGNDITHKYRAPKRTSFRGRIVTLIASASNRYLARGFRATSPAPEAR